jgi:hypothetical protein
MDLTRTRSADRKFEVTFKIWPSHMTGCRRTPTDLSSLEFTSGYAVSLNLEAEDIMREPELRLFDPTWEAATGVCQSPQVLDSAENLGTLSSSNVFKEQWTSVRSADGASSSSRILVLDGNGSYL